MAKSTLNKEEEKTPSIQIECLERQNDSKDEDIFHVFLNLKVAEDRLAEQKEHLTALLNQVKTKAYEEIERRKLKVERLKSEVSDLKRKTENFALWISVGSELECRQDGR